MLNFITQPVFSQYFIAIAFILAGALHFINPEMYIKIMPDYIPYHRAMVYLSGLAELLGGIALFIPKLQDLAAWGILLMLIVFLTVHVDMIIEAWGHQAGFWYKVAVVLRLPLQFVLMCWVYWAFLQA